MIAFLDHKFLLVLFILFIFSMQSYSDQKQDNALTLMILLISRALCKLNTNLQDIKNPPHSGGF